MHVECLVTFEQGMDKIDGGAMRMLAGAAYPAEQTEHGLQIRFVKRVRTVPKAILERLEAQGFLKVHG